MGYDLIGVRRGARLLLLAGLAVLAWQCIAFGVAIAGRRSDPALAVRLAPNNALALGALAQERLARDPAAAAEIARRALRRDPTNAAAIGTLGMALAQAGDMTRSTRLLAYGQSMSRRDLPTQIWAIETAVQQGDVGAALHHYDVALRVGRSMPTLLFPVLAGASADAAVRGPLVQMLRAGVPWGSSFLDYLSAQTSDIESAARLVADLQATGGPLPQGPVNILVQRLMEAGDIERAWALYARSHPGANRSGLRNGDFNTVVEMPTLFDWQLEDRGDARAEIVPGTHGGEMHVEARSGADGTVALQRLVLTPGSYLLAAGARAEEGATLADSVLELTCVPSKERIARVRLADVAERRREVRFSVPRGCASQSLEITLDAGATETTIEGAIDGVTLTTSGSGAALQ